MTGVEKQELIKAQRKENRNTVELAIIKVHCTIDHKYCSLRARLVSGSLNLDGSLRQPKDNCTPSVMTNFHIRASLETT